LAVLAGADELLEVVAAAARVRRHFFGSSGEAEFPHQPEERSLP